MTAGWRIYWIKAYWAKVDYALQFTAELRTLLRSHGPKNYGRQGFCPIAEGNLIGKTRYVRSLKGCEQ